MLTLAGNAEDEDEAGDRVRTTGSGALPTSVNMPVLEFTWMALGSPETMLSSCGNGEEPWNTDGKVVPSSISASTETV